MHVYANDAPFGGIGDSNMGHYHGKEGFLTFSKAKTVLAQGKVMTPVESGLPLKMVTYTRST